MGWTVECADVLEWAASYDGPKYHALLCDPPYELAFMGKDWDKSGIAFNPDTWAALTEHLHSGAFGMAFASARGWHRLACAIEDAGLRIHPSIFGWAQGSGFPKATRVKDKGPVYRWQWINRLGNWIRKIRHLPPRYNVAQIFDGHRYGLQAMKPALEPIIVFQKPYEGKPVECITATGAGALWVDGGRIGTADNDPNWRRATGQNGGADSMFGVGNHYRPETLTQGRWPANLVLTHLPTCERVGVKRVDCSDPRRADGSVNASWGTSGIYSGANSEGMNKPNYADPDGKETVADWRCEPECPVRRLGEMSGERKSGAITAGQPSGRNMGHIELDRKVAYDRPVQPQSIPASTGTAARFFYQADWSHEIAERLAAADPIRYVPKAARKERDAGLEGFADGETLGNDLRLKERIENGQSTNGRTAKKARNPHPTVKPIALARWLAALLLPPDAYAPRRLLVPFCGSGSEMVGAGLVGWEEITGIEFDADTCAIAEARLDHWLNRVQLEMGL